MAIRVVELQRSIELKRIEAIVRHHKLEDIKNALVENELHGMTVTDVRGFGHQRGHTESYRGAEYAADFLPKSKIEIVVPDAAAQQVVETILRVAQTGQIGDGKVFVSDVGQVLRIRTGEVGEEAL